MNAPKLRSRLTTTIQATLGSQWQQWSPSLQEKIAALLAALIPNDRPEDAIALPAFQEALSRESGPTATPEEVSVYRMAKTIQRQLADRVIICPLPEPIKIVAAADVAYSKLKQQSYAVATGWDIDGGEQIARSEAIAPINFPYIPGLLSFREAPVLFAALRELKVPFDVLLVDGQGLAHPLRFGLACHLGVLLDCPAIGCAKSRLCGQHGEVPSDRGGWAELRDGSDSIGRVLRTRSNVRPVYVSVGNKATLEQAADLILRLSKFRLPEPIRLADRFVGELRAIDEQGA